MKHIDYLSFDNVDPQSLVTIVNEDGLRTHLVEHPQFDLDSIQTWIDDKLKTDATLGCRVRIVAVDGVTAGWCGIPIFKVLMVWASDLGHAEVVFHLLDTRREYKALAQMATKVHRTQLMGRSFTTYHFCVGQHPS